MNEAQKIMTGSDLSHLAGGYEEPRPTQGDIVQASGDLLALVALAEDIPVDFDGCEITVLRSQDEGKLQALILSPVDMHGDEPFARYQIHPTHIKQPKGPSIVLPS